MSVDSVDPATRGVAGMHGRLGSMPIGRWHASAAPQSAWMVPTLCGRRRASETFDPHVPQMSHSLVQLAGHETRVATRERHTYRLPRTAKAKKRKRALRRLVHTLFMKMDTWHASTMRVLT